MSYKKPDYNYKSYILTNYQNLLLANRQSHCFDYALSVYRAYGVANWTLINGCCETTKQLKDYCYKFDLKSEYDECERLNNSFFCRKSRLNKRISKFVHNYDCSFLTLTFRNDVLDSTSKETRRRYVARYLKSLGVPYVANIDYGDNTQREHYHAIVCKKVDTKTWSYGFSDIEPIRKNKCSTDKLAIYITKLTNHAIKETTKRNALLYSRVSF